MAFIIESVDFDDFSSLKKLAGKISSFKSSGGFRFAEGKNKNKQKFFF